MTYTVADALTHPETYTLTRDEWLEVNRTLSGCFLALSMPGDHYGKRSDRLKAVRAAQEILSDVYRRAEDHTHKWERKGSRINRSLGCAIITYRCQCGAEFEEEKEVD